MRRYSKELIDRVSELLGMGFNSVEISKMVNKTDVTVRNIKLILKQRNKIEFENGQQD